MLSRQKLPLLWACVLLCAALCPSTQAKRGGGFGGRGRGRGWGRGVGVGNKVPSTQNRGSSSKQGLKLAGAAAAGALGGAAVGYGLSSMGQNQHYGGYGRGYGHGYGHGYDSSEEDQRGYYPEGYGYANNQSDYRYRRGAAGPGPAGWGALTVLLVALVPLFWVQWVAVM